MNILRKIALLSLVASISFAYTGCANEAGRESDPDTRLIGDRGMQSRDLREMTNRMAPDLLQIPEISRNPNRMVVVMKPIQNKLETDPGRDLTIYVARLKTLLNSSATRDRLAFVEDQATLHKLQSEELGGGDPFGEAGRTEPGPSGRIMPQYALWGTFYEKRESRSAYFLCTFRLTDLHTGLQIWENSYEVKALEH